LTVPKGIQVARFKVDLTTEERVQELLIDDVEMIEPTDDPPSGMEPVAEAPPEIDRNAMRSAIDNVLDNIAIRDADKKWEPRREF
jgi:hypothetical protein